MNTSRLRWGNFFDNVAYGITNIDRGIWYTLWMLFARSGDLLRHYIAGRRVVYFRPFSLLVILAGIYEVVERISWGYWNIGVNEAVESVAEAADEGVKGLFPILLENLKSGMTGVGLSSIVMLPLFALAMKRTFRKTGDINEYSFVEYLFVGAYMACQRLIIGLLLLPYKAYSHVHDGHYNLIFAILIAVIATWDFRSLAGLDWWTSFTKTMKMFIRAGIYIVIIFSVAIGLLLAVAAIFSS